MHRRCFAFLRALSLSFGLLPAAVSAAEEAAPALYVKKVENLPEDKQDDVDAVLDLMDWEKNVDPNYREHYFRPPIIASEEEGVYVEKWIVYGNPLLGAKELTVFPGQKVTIRDSGAFTLGSIHVVICEA